MVNAIATSQADRSIGLTWRKIVGTIPRQEGGLSTRNIASARELMSRPEMLGPELVEDFDGPVVAGFVQRREQDSNAQVQAQSHDLADLVSIAATAEGAFVVELGKVGNAQC